MVVQKFSLRSLASDQKHFGEPNEVIRVGRSPTSQIFLDDPSVSRQHAQLAYTEEGWTVQDLGSTNGTFLNGEVVGRTNVTISPGDVIRFGELDFMVDNISSQVESSEKENDNHFVVEDSVDLSWDNFADILYSPEIGEDPRAKSMIRQVIRTGRLFARFESVEEFLNSVLWETAEMFESLTAVAVVGEKADSLKIGAFLDFHNAGEQDSFLRNHFIERAYHERKSLLAWECDAENPEEKNYGLVALLRSQGKITGAILLTRKSGQQPFSKNDLYLADILGLALSLSVDSVQQTLERHRAKTVKTAQALTQILRSRNERLFQHGQRVTDYALIIADQLEISETDRNLLRIGAPLHDFGLMAVEDADLWKSDSLTVEEMEAIKSHVTRGADLLKAIPGLTKVLPIVRDHHERWDGKGYPDGIEGKNINILARIVAVAEAFDAMTSNRPHKPALTLDEAFNELEQQSGRQFDPACVEALWRSKKQIEEVLELRHRLTSTIGRAELKQMLVKMKETKIEPKDEDN